MTTKILDMQTRPPKVGPPGLTFNHGLRQAPRGEVFWVSLKVLLVGLGQGKNNATPGGHMIRWQFVSWIIIITGGVIR